MQSINSIKTNDFNKHGNNHLKIFIEKVFGPIPEKDWNLLNGILQPKSFAKGTEILSIGKHCNHLWFLIKGAVRTYELNNGVERSNYFFTDYSLFIDYYSIATKRPSDLCFVAEEQCEVLAMNYSDLLSLYNQSQLLERIGRIMAERQFVIEYEFRRMILNMDALERYQYLIENRPEIFQHFALKNIASFIGITPVSLSRLRKMK
jgi:CRP-like cAMP-binding protein